MKLLAAAAAIAALAAPVAANVVCGEIDVLWLMDESGSIGSGNYQTMKNFVSSAANPFTLGPQNTRMGVMEFDSSAPGQQYLWSSFTADTNQNKVDYQTHVNGLGFSGGGTNIPAVLTAAQNFLQTADGQARTDTVQIVALLTDGFGGSLTTIQNIAADLINNMNVVIVYIPIGSGARLDLFGNLVPQEQIFPITDFSGLSEVFDDLVENIDCFTPTTECLADNLWDLYPMVPEVTVTGNAIENTDKTVWHNGVELDSVVGQAPCCLRFGAEIFEKAKGMAMVGLMLTDENTFPLSGFLGNSVPVYAADSKDVFYTNGAVTYKMNTDEQIPTGSHEDRERDFIELIYCPGTATITITTYLGGIPRSFRTFENVPAGDYKLVTSLKNDQGAGPNLTTKVTVVIAECINCDVVERCEPIWGCRTNGVDIFDSLLADPVADMDGVEFTRRGWAELWRNAVSLQQTVFPGEVVELIYTLDFLISKGDFMVGINPDCDQSKIEQAKNSPLSIMYWGSGWIYVGGQQKIRIDWQQFYPRQGDEIMVRVDLIQGTVEFLLNDVSGGAGFQHMHPDKQINIPIRSYYAAGSIYYVNAKIGLRCPEDQPEP